MVIRMQQLTVLLALLLTPVAVQAFVGLATSQCVAPTRGLLSSSTDDDNTADASPPDDNFDVWKAAPVSRPKRRAPKTVASSSWMDKNNEFLNQVIEDTSAVRINKEGRHVPSSALKQFREDRKRRKAAGGNDSGEDVDANNLTDNNKTFRQDFRGTRVFVQNIPDEVSWQTLKDHFKIAGDVVFSSVSVDRETGQSKGHGVVQYATTEMARKACKMMRDHPLEGAQLYVRPDVQENEGAFLKNLVPQGKERGPTPPSKWKCADEDVLENGGMTPEDYKAIRNMIKARDDARFRKNYEASDDMREQLKVHHGVHLDDRLKLWWVSQDGKFVPDAAQKGEGRWGKEAAWRQIPTTPDQDALAPTDMVMELLAKRDAARKKKEFSVADALLEEARTCGDLPLRIHDESRTWRIWTEAPPPRGATYAKPENENGKSVADQCIALAHRHAPEKVDEVQCMLDQFPGREESVLQKLKQRYL